MEKTGFYIIKDNFFDIVNDPFLKGNKQGNRPHYYCFEDLKTGVYWIIPMSSKLEKYKKIIKNKEKKGAKCDTLHIAKLDNNKESVFKNKYIVFSCNFIAFPLHLNYYENIIQKEYF